MTRYCPSSSSPIRVIWKCSKPRSQAARDLCISLLTQTAREFGMDTIIIRKEAHRTTKVNGKYVKTIPHITGNIVNTSKNTGYALHWNLDETEARPIPSTNTAPNPQMWDLRPKYRNNGYDEERKKTR
ncbi:hypothetical protein CYLTODRAFT_360694 [Cylindrobasidium torrendii FP15055 ss-10]|uniref:Uncharacterized protein n=1 Tax=Cylindrobasidium torrendii FP15055 ss-10 TaxID=1314674 RepID=A0A0D7B0C1_9AGAR|nr:hypothetical protein CYLTODRAFT_360694 [Cylindrobasidium torrendii FP15055 ss-10]